MHKIQIRYNIYIFYIDTVSLQIYKPTNRQNTYTHDSIANSPVITIGLVHKSFQNRLVTGSTKL